MKLSKKSRYAVRAMFDMAFNACGEATQIKAISRRQKISHGYLEQIFIHLKAAELIRGRRGRNGGYVLARPSGEITILDILMATGADLSFADCGDVPDGRDEVLSDQPRCDFLESCVAWEMWDEISKMVEDYFSSITLKQMCEKAKLRGMEKDILSVFSYRI